MKRSSDAKPGFFQPVTLDVDEKIIDRNLKIVTDDTEEEFSSIFPGMTQASAPPRNQDRMSLLPEPDYPSVQVRYCCFQFPHMHLTPSLSFSCYQRA